MPVDIYKTYGPVSLGALIAVSLSGFVFMQSIVYWKVYPEDKSAIKLLVSTVVLLDSLHSLSIIATIWYYFVANFGDENVINTIPWMLALTIAITAISTFLVHCFFAHRIMILGEKKRIIAGVIATLALFRLIAALGSTVEMIRTGSFSRFGRPFPGCFLTIGLSLSAIVDILIAISLCYFLRVIRGRMGPSLMSNLIDSITLYTLQNGALPCIVTIVTFLCWVTMSSNLIFLGIHFSITKLYANSLLATLNFRRPLRDKHRKSTAAPFPPSFSSSRARGISIPVGLSLLDMSKSTNTSGKSVRLEVNVSETVECDDGLEENQDALSGPTHDIPKCSA